MGDQYWRMGRRPPEDAGMSFDGTIGALLIGYIMTWSLCAATTAQLVLYFRKSERGMTTLKGVVIMLWILDAAHIIVTSHALYTYVVLLHGNPLGLQTPLWSFAALILLTETSSLLVRCVFAHRIWKLSGGYRIIPIVVVLLSLFVMATGIVFGRHEVVFVSWVDARKLAWTFYSGYGTEVAVDSIIAASMIVLLGRLRTGIKRINTGILTTLFVVLSITIVALFPASLGFTAIYLILNKFYINSLLGTLNTQWQLLDPCDADRTTPIPILTSAIRINTQVTSATVADANAMQGRAWDPGTKPLGPEAV
ncbi:hypothetical protein A0H81_03890 [Grifola frondosa]|uniref:DUF6534 domain-containing protein n=1 Tax=Grifola frondosa TaxID=5627 RepID=A0A1C7MIL0_GRIFR|nr:hypothetical protein A0H81_03890 [Grifola frondosa]